MAPNEMERSIEKNNFTFDFYKMISLHAALCVYVHTEPTTKNVPLVALFQMKN